MGDAQFNQRILLPGDPTVNLHAATKQYVDARPGANVTVSNTAPSNPGNGDLWVDTSTPTWTAPSLGNNWVDYGSPYAPAGYYKDANGIVHLRGCIRSGTGAVAAFTLPTGYRPTAGHLQIIVSAYPAFAYLQVTTAGAVQVAAYYGTGTNAEVVLDNIHFATF